MDRSDEAAAIEDELRSVYGFYAALACGMHPDTGRGGALLYAGEPDETGCRLLRGASIAGAASLAACADSVVLRKAMRAGAIDFVVTTLDEALRILKNEIRKRQPVAVGVLAAPAEVVRAMVERGVQPDLLWLEAGHAPELTAEFATLEARGARRVARAPAPAAADFQMFPLPAQWVQRSVAFDALLVESVPAEDAISRRWLRFAPRYLDARTRRMRGLPRSAWGVLDSLLSSSGQCLDASGPES
jgi:Urocanase Rossmann-like domain